MDSLDTWAHRDDLDRGVFRADTPEEQERGLRILENLGRIRQSSPQPQQAVKPMVQPAMTPTSPLFRVVADEVIREVSLTLKKASVDKYRSTFDAYREYKGNSFVEDITRSHIKHFKDKLLSDGMVAHTVNGHLGRLHLLFEYAIKNQYVQGENPAAGLQIPHSKRAVKKRDRFYDQDLQTIYDWKNYEPMAITPDYFWGPLVCLFSAMRIEECTSLEVRNIKSDDGVTVMHIKDAKTPAGVRYVPLHSTLIKLGFLDYVETVKQMGHERLFWYLSEGARGKLVNHNGTKKNLSRHFSAYLEKIGVKQNDNCFHSLRHTTITRLVARKVNNSTIYQLSGHTGDKSAHDNYLHALPARVLQEAVEALDYQNVLLKLEHFDWKPALQQVLDREKKRAQTAERKRLQEKALQARQLRLKRRNGE